MGGMACLLIRGWEPERLRAFPRLLGARALSEFSVLQTSRPGAWQSLAPFKAPCRRTRLTGLQQHVTRALLHWPLFRLDRDRTASILMDRLIADQRNGRSHHNRSST